MRQITVKYNGECSKCGSALEVGQPAMYEKTTGIFCVGCEPTDTEEIRAYRQARADQKADRYDEWAGKREQAAEAQLNSYPSVRHDIAFITQPGHIPFRARMNRSDERAYESLKKADEMRGKAESLRHVRVKGDAAKADEAARQKVLTWVKPGMTVNTGTAGNCEVLKVNQKTVKVKGKFGNFNVPLHFLRQILDENEKGGGK